MFLSFFFAELFFLVTFCLLLVFVAGRDIFFKVELGLVFSRVVFVFFILLLSVYIYLLVTCDIFNLNLIFQNDLFFSSRLTIFYKVILALLLLLYFVFVFSLKRAIASNDLFVYLFMLLTFFFLSHVVEVNSILLFYGFLEASSFGFYYLVTSDSIKQSVMEVASKYFIMSGVSSLFFLFGLGLLYYAEGSLCFGSLPVRFFALDVDIFGEVGIIFILLGFFFKLGVYPFHQWVLDIYTNCRLSTLYFFVVLPKIAYIYIFSWFFFSYLFAYVNIISTLSTFFGIASIFVGYVGTYSALNLKRFYAYSAIGNMGLLLLLFVSDTWFSVVHAHLYVLFYSLLSLSFIILLTELDDSADTSIVFILHLQGLFNTYPFLALYLIMLLFSMAGLPPFLGFFLKFVVFLGIFTVSAWYSPLLLLLLLFMSFFNFYPYLRLISFIAFAKSQSSYKKASGSITSFYLVFFFLMNVLFFFIYADIFILFVVFLFDLFF